MLKGTILKGYSGFYYVESNGHVYECSLRGKNRQKNLQFHPGDRVLFVLENEHQGAIEECLERKTFLLRPPVANVSKLVIIMSLAYPEAEIMLLDRLLVLAEEANIQPLLVLNKKDSEKEGQEAWMRQHLVNTDYAIITSSIKTQEGIDEIKEVLAGETTVFAGQSGVGKTSLMNVIMPSLELKTGALGDKSKRGKHTTRHVELFPYRGGYIVDTPGFNRLYVPDMEPEHLQHCFPEFSSYQNECRFNSCLHDQEPGCMVKKHVDDIHIGSRRYQHYLKFLNEIQTKEKRYDD